jgi:hypothetical protein
VSVPGGVAELNLVPELRPCVEGAGAAEQSFELRHDRGNDGEIRFGTMCLAWEFLDGSVYLYNDCGDDRWTVTGALTTPSGLALTLGDGDDRATAWALDAPPSEGQTFDFYF